VACGTSDVGGGTGSPDAGITCLCNETYSCVGGVQYGAACGTWPLSDGGSAAMCSCTYPDGGPSGAFPAPEGCCDAAMAVCGIP
jgi:hypothetical protein